jgi:hypothetical protein
MVKGRESFAQRVDFVCVFDRTGSQGGLMATPKQQAYQRDHYLRTREKKLAYQRKWRQANKERSRGGVRRCQGNKNPDIAPRLRLVQADGCAVCQISLATLAERDVCVDHDHDTGLTRGVLCRRCNAGLGHFQDDPEKLRRAALYLEAPPAARKETT